MREGRRRDTVGAIHELPLHQSLVPQGGESPRQDPSLPPGWVWTNVGALYEIVGGGTPSTKVEHFWDGDIPWITSADIHGPRDIRPRKMINPRAIEESATNLVPQGSIIVVTRVGLGKVALTTTPMCFSQDAQALVSGRWGALPDYALYYLSEAAQVFKYRHRGTTIAGVTKKQLSDLGFALPPLPEQRRIVAKIEELFSQLDAGVEALQKVKTQLQRYRQAVLKHAFEGKLTAEWREAHRDELEPASALLERIEGEREAGAIHELPLQKGRRRPRKKLPPLDTSELPELPEGWVWTRIGDIGQVNPGLPSDQYSDDMVVSFVPMRAVQEETGEVDLSMQRPYCEVRRGYTPFVDGDVLFAKITPCMENGKAAVVRNLENGIGFGSTEFHVVRLAPASMVPQLLFFFLTGEVFRKEAQRHMTGSAGQLRVPTNYIRTALVPLATQREQLQMVDQIEVRLTCSRAIENTVDTTLQRVERLRQAILKRAFEGRLVAQDPSDEPAWKLLERIKAQKGRQGSTKKAGGRGRRERSPEATQGRLL